MFSRLAPQIIGVLLLAVAGLALSVWAMSARVDVAELQQQRAESDRDVAMAANKQLAGDIDTLTTELAQRQRAADELAEKLAANTAAAASWQRRYNTLLEREPDESCAFAAPGADLRRMLDHPGCANAADQNCAPAASAMPDASSH